MLISYYLRSPRGCSDLEDFHSRAYIVRGVQGYLRVMLLLLLFCVVLLSRMGSSTRWYFWYIRCSKRTLKRLSFWILLIFCERV
jgi:hypothetical protein